MTTLEQYREILVDIKMMSRDMEILNAKIIGKIGKKYHINNSIKHLERSEKLLKGTMKNKYGHLDVYA